MTNKMNPIIALGMGKQPNEGRRGASARSRVGTVGRSGELIPQDTITGFHTALTILMDFTCERFNVTRDDIVKIGKVKRSNPAIIEAKRFFYAAAFGPVRKLYPKLTTLYRIGKEMGVDHATASYHRTTHLGFMDVDPRYKQEFLEAIAVFEVRLEESSVPYLLSDRDYTINQINTAVSRLKTIDQRLTAHKINPASLQTQIKL